MTVRSFIAVVAVSGLLAGCGPVSGRAIDAEGPHSAIVELSD